MKLLVLFSLVLCLNLFATDAPFHKDEAARFKAVEDAAGVTYKAPAKERAGYSFMATAKATYDATLLGGTGTTDYALGVSIPADSIIVNVFYRVVDTVVSANDNTIALKCESAADLVAARDMTDISTSVISLGKIAMVATSTISTTLSGGALATDGCELTATIGAGASGITGAEVDFFVQYVNSEN